jgi:hypothetical protein
MDPLRFVLRGMLVFVNASASAFSASRYIDGVELPFAS